MRVLSDQLEQAISTSKNFTYCFEIITKLNLILCLTSAGNAMQIEEDIFLPNSALNITEGEFNDSAYNYITLGGIFEHGGVTQDIDLTDATVKILICFSDVTYHLITYYCSIYTKYDLNFTLYLEPETKKYQQALLKNFSKDCRVNFGDLKCKIDKTQYQYSYNLIEAVGNMVTLSELNKEEGYFDDGEIIFSDKFYAKILKQGAVGVIILDRVIPDYLKHPQMVNLIAGCDKKFITCCNKFNNEVNFRGEPFIPEDDFLRLLE